MPYIAYIREMGIRGANTKRHNRKVDVPHRSNHRDAIVNQPGPSLVDDHVAKKEEGWKTTACKGTWIAPSCAAPAVQHLGNFTVSVRRKFACVYSDL